MALPDKVAHASAFFATQISIAIMRNLVSTGTLPADVARKLVREALDQGVAVIPDHIPQLHEIAAAFDDAIEKGSSPPR